MTPDPDPNDRSAVGYPPAFAIRGVIEGFYGPTWAPEQRLDLVRFIAKHRMNFYGYGPKDDPFCRHAWDQVLPAGKLQELRVLTETGYRLGVSVAYGLSPGLSICYRDTRDRDRLVARYRQLADAGVRNFLLLFDDLPAELQHEQDRAAYGSLVDAQADLANFVRRFLDRELPGAGLMVCPTVYCGRGNEPYIRRLGLLLEEQIDIFWTGRTVWSSEIDTRDAELFRSEVGRKALYWDNYPANDLFMSGQLHLGPYRGRDRDLHAFARGVLVNPMTQCECSKIPLATIADYLRNPATYDADASWQRAIEEVAGGRDADAMRLFADNVRSSCLETTKSPMLTAALERVRFASRFSPASAERAAAAELVRSFERAAEQLLGPAVENAALAEEMRPWLIAFQAGARSLLQALEEGRLPPEPPVRASTFSSLAVADLLPDAAPVGRWARALGNS